MAEQMNNAQAADLAISCAIDELKLGKPGDRGEMDRKFAIVITEIEKAQAVLRGFLLAGTLPPVQ